MYAKPRGANASIWRKVSTFVSSLVESAQGRRITTQQRSESNTRECWLCLSIKHRTCLQEHPALPISLPVKDGTVALATNSGGIGYVTNLITILFFRLFLGCQLLTLLGFNFYTKLYRVSNGLRSFLFPKCLPPNATKGRGKIMPDEKTKPLGFNAPFGLLINCVMYKKCYRTYVVEKKNMEFTYIKVYKKKSFLCVYCILPGGVYFRMFYSTRFCLVGWIRCNGIKSHFPLLDCTSIPTTCPRCCEINLIRNSPIDWNPHRR